MKASKVKLPMGFSVQEAHQLQWKLAKKVIRKNVLPKEIQQIAGVDAAYVDGLSVGAVAVLDFKSLQLRESETAVCKTQFPYIPTLLSFRETPPVICAIKKLKLSPDVFLVDGHGIMHPYRLGLASHLGLKIARPTIGIAKTPLFGKPQTITKQGWAPITDKNDIIGATVVTKKGSNPVYVSTGHMVSLETAIAIVKYCCVKSRIPEPILQAHIIATEEKSKIKRLSKEDRLGDHLGHASTQAS